MTEKPIQILELFGGIGAPRAAMRNIGVPVRAIDYVEIDEKAVRSYNSMFQEDLAYKTQDVRGWNLKPDILVHGSPCQDFSIAGHQGEAKGEGRINHGRGGDAGSETRSSLMWETIRIIDNFGIWKPKVVIWENVRNVLSKHMIHNFNRYLSEMERMGYENAFETLDARDFGLPQKRQRVFTVSILGGPKFDFSKLQKRPTRPLSDFLEEKYELQHLVKSPSMLRSIGQKASPTFNGFIRVLQEGDAVDCITTSQDRCPNSGVIPIGEGKYRLLTELECWRLQGFSDEDFQAAKDANPPRPGCKNGTLYKQAGNSMPVPILEEIFRELKPYIVTQPSILSVIGEKGIRRATVIKDCANTITCRQDRTPAQIVEVLPEILYRFLTEKECWRLMGFSDEDYERASAALKQRDGKMNRDLYKQAGNSMPVPILEELFTAIMEKL